MDLSPIERTGLDVTADAIAGLFAPFVERELAAGDPAWARDIGRRKRKLLKQAARRLLGAHDRAGGRRDALTVKTEYAEAWQRIDYGMYALGRPLEFVSPWEYRGKHWLASDAGATRVRQLLLQRVVERVRPRRVLEIGCGNGINLMLLSARFPELELTGVDLTPEGIQAATALQRREALPAGMAEYGPQPTLDPTAFRRIAFRQGDAGALPFADGEFELVYTMLALEQMETLRERALSQLARVTSGHALMIEPFAEVNAAFWRRLNVYRRNYFRGSIDGLRRYGAVPEIVTADFPQEVFLGAAMVLARKS
jgi:ubiquinone/menaquinone biosynthesis C-methylase UbiE